MNMQHMEGNCPGPMNDGERISESQPSSATSIGLTLVTKVVKCFACLLFVLEFSKMFSKIHRSTLSLSLYLFFVRKGLPK